jgi:hypothetical protein
MTLLFDSFWFHFLDDVNGRIPYNLSAGRIKDTQAGGFHTFSPLEPNYMWDITPFINRMINHLRFQGPAPLEQYYPLIIKHVMLENPLSIYVNHLP